MTPETLEYYILLGLLIVVGVCMLLALVRCICGPKIGDRIVAVNMTNTLAVIARSGALRRAQMTDMTTLYDMKIMTDISVFFVRDAAIEHITRNTSKIMRNTSIFQRSFLMSQSFDTLLSV